MSGTKPSAGKIVFYFIREVRERVYRGEDPEPEDENSVEFDEEFVGRFRFTIEGEDTVDGHPAWILYSKAGAPFRRSARPAQHRQRAEQVHGPDLDRAERLRCRPGRVRDGRICPLLGRQNGTTPPCILGTLRNVTGRLEYIRVADGVWLPETLDVQIDLRILFRNIRRRIVREWGDEIRAGKYSASPRPSWRTVD